MKDEKKVQLSQLELQLQKTLREQCVAGASLLLAVSGGLDSMALLTALRRLRGRLGMQLSVSHIHHGAVPGRQGRFRDSAWSLVQGYCRRHKIPFYSNLQSLGSGGRRKAYDFTRKPDAVLKSELEMREFRYGCLEGFRELIEASGKGPCYLVLAHNKNDLLETRLLRLIRGTGLSGLGAMAVLQAQRLRPLLGFPRDEIQSYARARRVKWLDDPSNQDVRWLRNWVRHKWLPMLESRQAGSVASLGRSLEAIAREGLEGPLVSDICLVSGAIDHQRFLELSSDQKRQALAAYMRSMGMKNYGLSHINEVLKRLDTGKKTYTFKLLKHDWTVTANEIRASHLSPN